MIIGWFERRVPVQTFVTAVTVWGIFYGTGLIICIIRDFRPLDIPALIIDIVLLIWTIWRVWTTWKKWKDRKKALNALGNKAKALRAKLVRTMKEGTVPSPVKVPT